MSEQLNASGGASAPAEILDYDKVEEPVSAAILIDEERELAEALIEVVEKYGKFNADNTGVWAGYDSAEKNAENAAIGVKCGNCVFWEAPNGCKIIHAETEEGGLCRFAILPDGAVTADVGGYGGKCPPATQDIQLNLENRQNAIDNVGYGPLNPALPNDVFWQDKAERWNTTVREVKSARCGNCIFFVRTPKMLECLEEGIGLGNQEAEGSIEAGELGYCNALDFKCASKRTCNAWAAGGPVTEESEESVTATAGSKPAPKKDRIFGSKKNKKGSAATGKGISFSKKVEKSLSEKVKKHNEKAKDGRKTSLRTLKAVYRRGAGAFSTSHRPDQNRNSWAMARVNAYLHLLRTGRPKNSKYTTDNDLLPASHPKSSKRNASSLAAAGYMIDSAIKEASTVRILPREEYVSDEHAIFSLAEYSDLSYEIIPSIRASWNRALEMGMDPFERASELAMNLYDSPDADLLPKKEDE